MIRGMYMNCLKCEKEVSPTAKFCESCGSALTEQAVFSVAVRSANQRKQLQQAIELASDLEAEDLASVIQLIIRYRNGETKARIASRCLPG